MSTKTRFRVEGMDCAGCASLIDMMVRKMPGVEDVSVSVTAASMTVQHAAEPSFEAQISSKVASLGYKAIPVGKPANDDALKTLKIIPSTSMPKHDHHAHDHAGHDHAGHDHSAHDHAKHDEKPEAASGLHGHDHGPTDGSWWQSRKGQITIAAGLAVAAAWGVGQMVPSIGHWAFVVAMLVGLVPDRSARLHGRPSTAYPSPSRPS